MPQRYRDLINADGEAMKNDNILRGKPRYSLVEYSLVEYSLVELSSSF